MAECIPIAYEEGPGGKDVMATSVPLDLTLAAATAEQEAGRKARELVEGARDERSVLSLPGRRCCRSQRVPG